MFYVIFYIINKNLINKKKWIVGDINFFRSNENDLSRNGEYYSRKVSLTFRIIIFIFARNDNYLDYHLQLISHNNVNMAVMSNESDKKTAFFNRFMILKNSPYAL
jgi:hypothetical protein